MQWIAAAKCVDKKPEEECLLHCCYIPSDTVVPLVTLPVTGHQERTMRSRGSHTIYRVFM